MDFVISKYLWDNPELMACERTKPGSVRLPNTTQSISYTTLKSDNSRLLMCMAGYTIVMITATEVRNQRSHGW